MPAKLSIYFSFNKIPGPKWPGRGASGLGTWFLVPELSTAGVFVPEYCQYCYCTCPGTKYPNTITIPMQVLAKYLECPVNPADINVLQGTYPIRCYPLPLLSYPRPPLPATGGGEGVAEILAVGRDSPMSLLSTTSPSPRPRQPPGPR